MSGPHEHASLVCHHDGFVLIDGPGPVAVTLTVEAADETAHRLMDVVAEAHGRAIMDEQHDR